MRRALALIAVGALLLSAQNVRTIHRTVAAGPIKHTIQLRGQVRAKFKRPATVQLRLQKRTERIEHWFGKPDRLGRRRPKGRVVRRASVWYVSQPRYLFAWAQELLDIPMPTEPKPTGFLVLVFKDEQTWDKLAWEVAVSPSGVILWTREEPAGFFDFNNGPPTASIPAVSADGRRAVCYPLNEEDLDFYTSYFAKWLDEGVVEILDRLPADWQPATE